MLYFGTRAVHECKKILSKYDNGNSVARPYKIGFEFENEIMLDKSRKPLIEAAARDLWKQAAEAAQ